MSVKMLCFLVLSVLVMTAEVKASREIRSPGGSGWQGSSGGGYGGLGSARSSFGGWSGSASGRSQGWNGLSRSGGSGDYSGFSGRSSGCGSGWDSSSGFRSNSGGYSSW